MSRRQRVKVSVMMAAVFWAVVCASARGRTDTTIDQAFVAYSAGDHDVVARMFLGPADFQLLRLDKPQVLDAWLGAWNIEKAKFAIELAKVANDTSPTRTWALVSAGRRYLLTRHHASPAPSAALDEFEQTWHQVALGLLQRHVFGDYEEMYLTDLQSRGKQQTSANILPERFALERGIAQEQRCWNKRESLDRAGDAADAVARAAGQQVKSRDGISKGGLDEANRRQQACWSEAVARFSAGFESRTAGAEARVRAAWMQMQLGRFEDALETIDEVDPGDDRDLAYWAGLFRGRIDDTLGRHADAERAYRAALEARPGAQSAGIGLALTLFKMDRDAEADAAALQVRTGSTNAADPWWTYLSADQRFVDRWIGELRGMHR
jgi:tetratricopeptide (TPR) repeat protein